MSAADSVSSPAGCGASVEERVAAIIKNGNRKDGVAVEAELRTLLTQRIVIIDGAMGTMIQRCHFEEPDFQGE